MVINSQLWLSVLVAVISCIIAKSHATSSNADYQEKWGYITVRPQAHMFWWLMHKSDTSRPLVVWLQGGPGASSTGFGNFQELGPLDANLQPRSTTWVGVVRTQWVLNRADLIFIDNPVGTGYSYVDSSSAFTTDVDGIAADLLTWSKQWFDTNTEFQSRPFYIMCESYGGKMTAAWAKVLYDAVQKGEVKANFKGIGLGDSWISAIDYVTTWPDHLQAFSFLGDGSYSRLRSTANQCQSYVDRGEWNFATNCWEEMESDVETNTDSVSFYNVLKRSNSDPWSKNSVKAPRNPVDRLYQRHVVAPYTTRSLNDLMNGEIKRKLGIPNNVTWGGQSGQVFSKQSTDFMKPVVATVDHLLMNTNVKVNVFNGQLDLICCTLGTQKWVNRLTWPGIGHFHKAQRSHVRDSDGQTGMFYKTYQNFSFYWILRGGHMVAHDAPEAVDKMLQQIFSA